MTPANHSSLTKAPELESISAETEPQGPFTVNLDASELDSVLEGLNESISHPVSVDGSVWSEGAIQETIDLYRRLHRMRYGCEPTVKPWTERQRWHWITEHLAAISSCREPGIAAKLLAKVPL